MTELVRLYTQIALLRRGPQDVPGSAIVLVATVLGYFVVNFAVSFALPPLEGAWLGRLAVEVVFVLAWYGALLQIARKPERFLQTASALFGFQTVLAPLIIITSWLSRRHAQDTAWHAPLFILWAGSVVWVFAASSQIVKAALEWPLLACVGIVLLHFVAGGILMYLLFGQPR